MPLGISLAGFAEVIKAAGGREHLEGKSTDWLKKNHVLSATHAEQFTYASLLSALPNGSELVGTATHFLSHAYSMEFLCSVDAATAWASRNPRSDSTPHFFYFDLLVVNQHGQTKGIDPAVLWEEFAGGVLKVGHTLLVLTYHNPSPLTRAWCLAEIVAGVGSSTTGELGSKFEVIMPPREELLFTDALVQDFDSVLSKMCGVNLANATAWHGGECLVDGECRNVTAKEIKSCPNDLQFVRNQVKKGLGFHETDKRIISCMRQWMAGAGESALNTLQPGLPRANSPLVAPFVRLLMELGRLKQAGEVLTQALGERERAAFATSGGRGALPVGVLELQLELSELLWRSSPATAAASALDMRTRVYYALQALPQGDSGGAGTGCGGGGLEGVLTLRAGHALGVLMRDTAESLHGGGALAPLRSLQGEEVGDEKVRQVCKSALALLTTIAALRARTLGPNHPDTRATETVLQATAFSLKGQRQVEDALSRFLGRGAGVGLAVALGGDKAEAAQKGVINAHRKELESLERTHGATHPLALQAKAAFGELLLDQGLKSEGIVLLEKVLEERVKLLGDNHPDTLTANFVLGKALAGIDADGLVQAFVGSFDAQKHRDSRAEQLLKLAWEGRKLHDIQRAAESGVAYAHFFYNDPTFSHNSVALSCKILREAAELSEGEKATSLRIEAAIQSCLECMLGPCARCCCAHKPKTAMPLSGSASGESKL